MMNTPALKHTFLFLVLPLCLSCFSLWQLAERIDGHRQEYQEENAAIRHVNDSLEQELHRLQYHNQVLTRQADSLRSLVGHDTQKTTQLKTNQHEATIRLSRSSVDQLYRFFAGFDTTTAAVRP